MAEARRCAVLLILAEHEFKPALLDRVPLAGVKDRLELIEARRRGGPVTIAIPGKSAPAGDPAPEAIHEGKRDQANRQGRRTAMPGTAVAG